MMTKSMPKALELHYPIIQFLIIKAIESIVGSFVYRAKYEQKAKMGNA